MSDARAAGFDRAKEQRLETLREAAASEGLIRAPGIRPVGGPLPVDGQLPGADARSGYYGLPLLKAPVWTWEVPAYFFIGGAAGGAAVIAPLARWAARDGALERDARLIALVGGVVLSPMLLISDLGRPARFLYMLRVIKPQSPMSVGVWTLVAYSGAVVKAAALRLAAARVRSRPLRIAAQGALVALDASAALLGLALSTYTGVLIAVSAIPVWARNARLLPFHFGISGLGTAAALLELRHDHDGLRRIGIGVSAVETAMASVVELRRGRAFDPLHEGRTGRLIRLGAALSGPVPLALRLLGRRSRLLRIAAAVSFGAGAAITRYAWIAAGRRSAEDPREPLQLDG